MLCLGIYLVEDDFFHRLFYGDKDVMRFAHFFMQMPFYLVPHIPASANRVDKNQYRDSLVHFHGSDPSPFIFHQLKSGNPEVFRHIYRLKPEVRDRPSFCGVSSRVVTDRNIYEKMTMANSKYNASAAVEIARKLYSDTEKYFAAIK